MRVLAVINQKGGVAKTTTAHHLGVAFAQMGRKVLLIDLDPQASLTFNCGYRLKDDDAGIEAVPAEVIAERSEIGVADIALEVMENLDLAPASVRLASVQDDLRKVLMGREFVLKQALVGLDYDYAGRGLPPFPR